MPERSFCWACPHCQSPLTFVSATVMSCPRDCGDFCKIDGIWRMLTPSKAAHYQGFVQNYDTVRHGEQWGAKDGDYYRALPYRDLSGRHAAIWRIRAASFETLLNKVIRPLGRSLCILDAGAGNGWLSYRLAGEGHFVMATDLRIDDVDGLGACSWYMQEVDFAVAQATFEEIPLCDSTVDMVIFGGSIHYAAHYEEAIQEALRVLRPGGLLCIFDTPVYRDRRNGTQMVEALYEQLQRDFDIDPRVARHENYLTVQRLDEISFDLGVSWQVIEPFYGWRWALAPWIARIKRRRQPARFYVIVGKRPS